MIAMLGIFRRVVEAVSAVWDFALGTLADIITSAAVFLIGSRVFTFLNERVGVFAVSIVPSPLMRFVYKKTVSEGLSAYEKGGIIAVLTLPFVAAWLAIVAALLLLAVVSGAGYLATGHVAAVVAAIVFLVASVGVLVSGIASATLVALAVVVHKRARILMLLRTAGSRAVSLVVG